MAAEESSAARAQCGGSGDVDAVRVRIRSRYDAHVDYMGGPPGSIKGNGERNQVPYVFYRPDAGWQRPVDSSKVQNLWNRDRTCPVDTDRTQPEFGHLALMPS